MTIADQALEAFKSSDYTKAVELYTQALADHPTSFEYYLKRSIAQQRLSQYDLALSDAEIALKLARERGKREAIGSAQMRRGIALFLLKRFGDAGFCFNLAEKRIDKKEENMLGMWRKKLELELGNLDEDAAEREVMVEEYPGVEVPMPVKPEAKESQESKEEENPKDTPVAPVPPPAGVVTPHSKIRHEWYQTPSNVVLTLYVKGVPKDKANVEITAKTVSISFPLLTGSDFVFDVDPLFDDIDPSQSSYSILSTKIEVKLLKANAGKKWADLEGILTATAPKAVPVTSPESSAAKPVYPTSSKSGPKDWDKVAAELTEKKKKKGKGKDGEEEDSDVEGDPVNSFFKQLYSSADEDTKRAMMKSYVESNGTALSTNWAEVGKAKVETSPPDGMVAKQWNE